MRDGRMEFYLERRTVVYEYVGITDLALEFCGSF
jgi:hypothetical protein